MASTIFNNINTVSFNTRNIGISCLVYVAFAIFYISGSNSAIHNYIQVILFGAWVVTAVLEDSRAFWKSINNKATRFLLLFLLYYFITSTVEATVSYTMTYVVVFLMLYSCYVPYLYYRERNRKSEIKLIVVMTFLAWTFFALSAITFYEMFPSAARTLAADFTAFEDLYIGGGYAIAIGSALVIVWLLSILTKYHSVFNKKTRYFCIAFLVILFYLLIKTESTTTLLACVFGSIASFIYLLRNSKSNSVRVLLFLVVSILLILIVTGGLNTFGSSLVSATDTGADENVILRRLNRIGEKLMFAGSSSSPENYVDERWGLVVLSWNTFLQNPIFGVGFLTGNIFSNLEMAGVGTHSEMCDVLAQHGIVGCFFLYGYLKYAIRTSYKRIANNGIFITLVILALFNPFRYFHGFFAILTLMPMVELLVKNKISANLS